MKKLIGMWSHTHANEFCDFHNTAIYCILYISFFLSMMCIFLLFFIFIRSMMCMLNIPKLKWKYIIFFNL